MNRTVIRRTAAVLLASLAWGAAALGTPPAEPARPATEEDTTAWNRYFTAWEASSPTDARLWIDRFNYLLNRSRQTVVVLRGKEEGTPLPEESGEGFVLRDSTGSVAGSLMQQTVFDEALFARAIAAIDRGILLHPDRLDMRLGRAAAYRLAGHYDRMVRSLTELMDRAEQNGGRWLPDDSTARQVIAPQKLIADYLQDYATALFEAVDSADDPIAAAFGRLAEREAAYCPTSPVALNNVAIWHFGSGRLPEALEWFLHAAQADPRDAMPAYNIGYLYAIQGDRANARIWWTKLLDCNNEAYRAAAPELLRRLDQSASE